MTASSIVHSTFVVERTYPASPARVFAAFSNPATKRRWFAEGEGWQVDEFNVDFRVGGRETGRFRFKDGPRVANETVYQQREVGCAELFDKLREELKRSN